MEDYCRDYEEDKITYLRLQYKDEYQGIICRYMDLTDELKETEEYKRLKVLEKRLNVMWNKRPFQRGEDWYLRM
ncbi:MAG TPA: hypothetical protein VM660_05765 [Bacillus sp. (in: firmicutes)]|nr:hypothetical protein [Bacillus sp. (in: firmicutes)]